MLINGRDISRIVFFTGAGMSAESGVPTYRGQGGIWHKYNWDEFACQDAFDRNPEKVLKFHELRRQSVGQCEPHSGHRIITKLECNIHDLTIVTQNIDGLHQRAGTKNVIELHGSLWRLRCGTHGVIEDLGEHYKRYQCEHCNTWLRPDITWFNDMLNPRVIEQAQEAIKNCDLFVGIGTSAVVWPAAGLPRIARENNAYCVEINPEWTEMSDLYDDNIRDEASTGLAQLFEFE